MANMPRYHHHYRRPSHRLQPPHAATPEVSSCDGDDDDVYVDIDRTPPLISPLSDLLPSLCGDNTATSVVSSSGSGSGSSIYNSNSNSIVVGSRLPRPHRYSYTRRHRGQSHSNSSNSSSSYHLQASAPPSSLPRHQHPMQHRVISTSNYNSNIANHNSNMNTLDIASGSTAALQFTNPKHFNAYHGVAQTNNTVGTAPSTASMANPALSSAAAATSVQQQQQRRDELTQKLSQYTRQNDRRQTLRALTDTKLFPRMHGPLPSVYGVEDIAMAEREAAGERASLNGVKFLQVNHHQHTMDHQPLDSYFLQTLREVCGHMCEMDAVDADPMALYGGLLLRLCRSASEHDALTVLTNYVCGSKGGELILLPLKRRHHDTTSSSTGAEMYLPMAVPLELDLYVESGNVHAKVTMRHELGLFKRSDLESAGFQKELSPWNALVMLIQQVQQHQPHTSRARRR